MKLTKYGMASVLAVLLVGGMSVQLAGADEGSFLINGETKIITKVKAPEDSPLDEIISGWEFRDTATQALETDDFENPGFILVDQGEELWSTVDGSEGKSCASCHNDAAESMKGVRAAMPKWSEAKGKPQTLEHNINTCRTERMGAEAWKWESDQMLGMTAYIGLQSRGMPVDVQTDGPMEEWWSRGKELYYTRVGQLDMACSNCHEDNYGNMIRADHLSQGHINGFPVYRFKWQKLGSIHRRFKGCMENIRAVPYKRGSDEFTALELYVASRGEGLSVETPSVRN
jgi:sulfur-oxidizing protein SoxA